MTNLESLGNLLLLEQDTSMSVIRKGIAERIPISIYYKGPPDEVRSGQRIDIEPIVMGKNAKSGNLVIWAYVFKGVSKRGLPGWKMFRLDRITSAKPNTSGQRFKLGDLPGYVKGKAPSMMKSLSSVDIFSPYWFDDDEKYVPTPPPEEVPTQEPVIPQPEPAVPGQPLAEPKTDDLPPSGLATKTYRELEPQIRDVNGRRMISRQDYDTGISNLSGYQEDQWRTRQRSIGGNERPGEGTRKRFNDTSKFELDRLLAKDNIDIGDDAGEMLAEGHRIQSRIKRLIKW
jgi:hypothetical protein